MRESFLFIQQFELKKKIGDIEYELFKVRPNQIKLCTNIRGQQTSLSLKFQHNNGKSGEVPEL